MFPIELDCAIYNSLCKCLDPNGSGLFAAGSLTNTVGSQNFRTFSSNHLFVGGAADAGDIEADHTDSGIFMDCADRNRITPHLGD